MLYFERQVTKRGYRTIAGIDEAGRGPLAGPVVACALILKSHNFSERIDDSKKLSAKQRNKAFTEISKKATWSTAVVGHKAIDRLNIRQATIKAMKIAVLGLPFAPDYLLIDGRIVLDLPIPSTGIINGDARSMTIACASIIAKVTRDRIMQKYHNLFPDYGFDRHKGYGTRRHLQALQNLGPCRIHRLSFKPCHSYAPLPGVVHSIKAKCCSQTPCSRT